MFVTSGVESSITTVEINIDVLMQFVTYITSVGNADLDTTPTAGAVLDDLKKDLTCNQYEFFKNGLENNRSSKSKFS